MHPHYSTPHSGCRSSRDTSCQEVNDEGMTSPSFVRKGSSRRSPKEMDRKVGEIPCISEQTLGSGSTTNGKARMAHLMLPCSAWNRSRSIHSSDEFRRICATSLMTIALVVTVVTCSLPAVVYFTISVSHSRSHAYNCNVVSFAH